MFRLWLLSMALTAQAITPPSGTGPTAGPMAAQTLSSAWIEAQANRTRMKVAPSFKREPAYVRPEDARSRGEFGTVVLSAIIGKDGRVREANVKISSRSASIDAAALASAPSMLFEPARDANGNALDIVSKISLEYTQVDFHGPRSLAQYRCDQFVQDYDWWYRTWPAGEEDRIFKTLRGLVVISESKFSAADFAAEWKTAIEACRSEPGALMLDMLKPHGAFIRGATGNR
jgi:TonB family protein